MSSDISHIKPGTTVRVKSTASGSDVSYANRRGVVVAFDPSLPWRSPRALLAPEQFVCIHFIPTSKRQWSNGSPMDFIDPNNLIVID